MRPALLWGRAFFLRWESLRLSVASSATIYFDNNATTRPSEGVVAAVAESLRSHWHNPSSVHRPGQEAKRAMELARGAVAQLIDATGTVKASEITFTSGGTESIDLAVRGVLGLGAGGGTLVTTAVEHAAVRDLAEQMEKVGGKDGGKVVYLPLDRDGRVELEGARRVFEGLSGAGGLLSVQWANNETGVVQPVRELAAMARGMGGVKGGGWLVHIDATQWVGKEPTALVEERGGVPFCDLLTLSPHKFHGPKGVGVLWVRKGVRLSPRLLGSQELGRRGGTEPVPAIVGAGVAAEEAGEWLKDAGGRARGRALRDRFEREVLAAVPDAVVNGGGAGVDGGGRLWNTTNIGFPRLEAEALLLLMSERGLAASAGAACSSGSLDPSPVLLAMGVSPEVAHGSVRFSLSKETTEEEVERGVGVVVECVRRLRGSMVG